MIGVEECIKEEFKSLHDCLRISTEWMLQMVLKEKVFVEEENLYDYKKRRKRRSEATGEKKPYMETLLTKFRCGCRGVLEIAQECFFKEGNRGLDPRSSRTSFKNKFGKAQHI